MSDLSFENRDFLWGNDAGPVRILSEYLHPKAELTKQDVKNTLVVFGSARIPSPETKQSQPHKDLQALSKYYEDCVQFTKEITKWAKNEKKNPLLVCTGGGPGIMEAGNRGAKEAGGKSLALNIVLPHEQEANPFAIPDLTFEFHYFFMRKLWFMKHCRGMAAFPGGFGTFDELFETLTLVQTGKKKKIPILLYGSEFWKKVVNFTYLADLGLISTEDLDLFGFADTPEEAVRFFQERIRFELTQTDGTKS